MAVSDERTNSLIVRGIPEYVDRARKLIELLDTQTPQVLIEGKVIEASEGFSRAINGNLSMIERESTHGYGMSFNGAYPYDVLFGAGGTLPATNPYNASTASANGFSGGYQKLIGGNLINMTLKLAESENKVKVVSSPRAVVMNKQSATITQTFPVIIQQTTISNGTITTTPTQKDGTLSLNVTPTVTGDNSVLMQLTLQRDVVAQLDASTATVATRNITSNVLVESGTTLVMGGFYNTDMTESEGGIPFLRKLPIIGWLFGNQSKQENRSELMFFITPQVINAKKAGLVGST